MSDFPWRAWFNGITVGWLLGMSFVLLAQHLHIGWS